MLQRFVRRGGGESDRATVSVYRRPAPTLQTHGGPISFRFQRPRVRRSVTSPPPVRVLCVMGLGIAERSRQRYRAKAGLKQEEGLKAGQSKQGIHNPNWQTADEDKADVAGVQGAGVVNCIASEPCGGYLDASDAGYITTPGYPLEYPPHQNCRWVITAPEPSQRIVLNFNPHFEIEKLDC
eukprot:superscaffoldBa00002420_g14180